MAKLTVLKYPTPSLKKPSVPVEKVTKEIQALVKDMFETMHVSSGIGLAAPQVGKNLNLFVMDAQKPDPIDPEKYISNPLCLINPKIVHKDGLVVFEEGCLSCPGLLVDVKRAKDITVEFLDAKGKPQTLELTDLEAICVQHEMDHLQGILLIDHISRLKRELYRKQRLKEKKEEMQESEGKLI